MKDKYLDVSTIKEKVKRQVKSISGRAFSILVLIFVVIWVVLAWVLGSLSNFLWSGLLFVPVISLLVYIYLTQQRRNKAIENCNFYLVEDTCVKKEFIAGNADADDRYFLFFKENGKYVEYDGCQYKRTAIGDSCYLLKLGSSKKTYWTFNKQDWCGLAGFEKRGALYYPQKDN